jgi:hypothetical protein
MTRLLLVAVTAAAIGSLAAPGISGAQTSPTLTLEEACTTVDGTRLVGLRITVSGVPPFSPISGSLTSPSGSEISATVFANEAGVFTLTFFAGPGVYTVRVTSPFTAVQSLAVDCLPNNKDECRNGGWQTFGVFRNHGDCVSFVATGGKNPPAGT